MIALLLLLLLMLVLVKRRSDFSSTNTFTVTKFVVPINRSTRFKTNSFPTYDGRVFPDAGLGKARNIKDHGYYILRDQRGQNIYCSKTIEYPEPNRTVTGSYKQCRQRCSSLPDCAGFTYYRPIGATRHSGECYLLSKIDCRQHHKAPKNAEMVVKQKYATEKL